MASISFARASETAFSMYSKAALPLAGSILPRVRLASGRFARSSTQIARSSSLAGSTLPIASTGRSVPTIRAASAMTLASPMTTARVLARTSSRASAIAIISGPTPAASPIVMPTIGSSCSLITPPGAAIADARSRSSRVDRKDSAGSGRAADPTDQDAGHLARVADTQHLQQRQVDQPGQQRAGHQTGGQSGHAPRQPHEQPAARQPEGQPAAGRRQRHPQRPPGECAVQDAVAGPLEQEQQDQAVGTVLDRV